MRALALLHAEMGDYEKADGLFSKCIDRAESTFGENSYYAMQIMDEMTQTLPKAMNPRIRENLTIFISTRMGNDDKKAEKIASILLRNSPKRTLIVRKMNSLENSKYETHASLFRHSRSSFIFIPVITETVLTSAVDNGSSDHLLLDWDNALDKWEKGDLIILPCFIVEMGVVRFNLKSTRIQNFRPKGCKRTVVQMWNTLVKIRGVDFNSSKEAYCSARIEYEIDKLISDFEIKEKMILQKLINHGKLPVNRMKLIFLGNGEAGKTSLLRALRGERFCEVLDRTNYMECLHVEQKQLDNWEEYEDISQVARSVNIARRNQIFASNTAINQSENEASVVVAARNLATVSENSAPLAPPSSNTGTIIENTRSLDLQNDVFSTENSLLPAELPDSEEIIKLLDELNTFTLEDDSFALSVFDFAGQDKYASLQQLFVTSNAVYVVVFNIKKMFLNKGEKLNKEEFQVVLGWLTTIHLRAPDAKVVLVASQADGDLFDKNRLALAKQLPDFFQQIAKKILGVFDLDRLGSFKDKIPISFLKQIVHVDDNNEAIFVTSSKSGLGISKLKKVINETVRCTILHSEHKPMGWIQLHDELAKKIQRKELRLVYSVQAMFDELIGNNRKFGIRSVKELRAALEYFHNIGVVLYYPDNDELRQYVFPDPQMLVTVVSSIFQKERPDSEFQHKNRFISGCWTKPLLEETLLNTRVEKDCIPLLLSVLKEFDLYCEPAFENGVDSFLGGDIIIPCLLSNFRCGHDLPDAYCRSSIEFTTVGLILTFQGNTLPRGLFHQLAIRFASRSPRAYIPKLHLYDAIVSLGGSRQLIMKEELVHGVISLRLFLNAENIRLDFLHAWTTVNATIKAVLAEHWSNRTNKSRYKLSVQCHGKDFEEYVPHGIPTILEFDSEYPENITFCDHHSHSGNLELENLRKFWFKDNSPESQTTDLSRVELKKMIMLSYSWGEYDSRLETYPDQVRVRNLKVALEKRGLNVWFDDEDMRGDMIDTMRNVIMNCAAVVACVSNSYHIKHRNAYDEFIFPCEVKRDRVIGVKLTPDADMLGGAYGFKKGKNELYYDVSGTDQGRVESQLDNLASALKIFIP